MSYCDSITLIVKKLNPFEKIARMVSLSKGSVVQMDKIETKFSKNVNVPLIRDLDFKFEIMKQLCFSINLRMEFYSLKNSITFVS